MLGTEIEALRTRLGMSQREFDAALLETLLSREYSVKGGVGVLEHDVFAIVDGERNELRLHQRKDADATWVGAAASVGELVVLVRGLPAATVPLARLDDLQIVAFTMRSIKFVDFGSRVTGTYVRRSPQRPKTP